MKKTSIEIDKKILELSNKYYPEDNKHWNERHRVLAMFGEFIHWLMEE